MPPKRLRGKAERHAPEIKSQARSIQGTWDRFERWASRYKKICMAIIDEISDKGHCGTELVLFSQNWSDLNLDIIMDCNLERSELAARINNRIRFLRAYLVDISFDGEEFMYKYSQFLSCQYPKVCDKQFAFWLEQYIDGNPEAGGYSLFQEFEASFFCKDPAQIDFASMRTVLPFDRMLIRRPNGEVWDRHGADAIMATIREDIKFDYDFRMYPSEYKGKELLVVNFVWS